MRIVSREGEVRLSREFGNRNGPRGVPREDRRHRVVPARVPRGKHPDAAAAAAAAAVALEQSEAAFRGGADAESAEEAEAAAVRGQGQRRRQRDRHRGRGSLLHLLLRRRRKEQVLLDLGRRRRRGRDQLVLLVRGQRGQEAHGTFRHTVECFRVAAEFGQQFPFTYYISAIQGLSLKDFQVKILLECELRRFF